MLGRRRHSAEIGLARVMTIHYVPEVCDKRKATVFGALEGGLDCLYTGSIIHADWSTCSGSCRYVPDYQVLYWRISRFLLILLASLLFVQSFVCRLETSCSTRAQTTHHV